MTKVKQKVDVYDYKLAEERIIIYFYDYAGNRSGMDITQTQFENWLRYAGRKHTTLSCEGQNTACEMTMPEYWQELPKTEHLGDLTDFIHELKQL